MTLLEADQYLRRWRRLVVATYPFVGYPYWWIGFIDTMLDGIWQGGTRPGYIGPERQIDGATYEDIELTKAWNR